MAAAVQRQPEPAHHGIGHVVGVALIAIPLAVLALPVAVLALPVLIGFGFAVLAGRPSRPAKRVGKG